MTIKPQDYDDLCVMVFEFLNDKGYVQNEDEVYDDIAANLMGLTDEL